MELFDLVKHVCRERFEVVIVVREEIKDWSEKGVSEYKSGLYVLFL